LDLFSTLTLIDVFRIIPVFVVLAVAGYLDHKTGEVPNKVWLYGIVGFIIMLTETAIYASNMFPFIFTSMAICFGIAYALFRFRYGWGGADAKCLMMLAMCIPVAPAYQAWLPLYPMLIFGVASMIALVMMTIKKQRTIRFLPYTFFALIIVSFIV
jgi:Flp pilus assembly protein protease CpaA